MSFFLIQAIFESLDYEGFLGCIMNSQVNRFLVMVLVISNEICTVILVQVTYLTILLVYPKEKTKREIC